MMQVNPHTQAVLLLTAYFSRPGKDDPTPLTVKEWGRFAHWLNDRSLKPEQLVLCVPRDLLSKWHDKTITPDRIERLIDRGSALALAMEKWTRAGLWVLTRSDPEYPARLKKKLGSDAPALFFGCGNPKLLSQSGIAVVGSRRASPDDLAFAAALGCQGAAQGYSIVSGGARGIDEAAMLAALEADGTVVGILADSLLRASSSQKYRRHLMAKNLVLVSPFYPEAGFNAGNAMSRNKHIYCLSEAAVVVHSGSKGGTWSGSLEAIKREWVPVWVKETQDTEAGNEEIIRKGGLRLATPVADIQFSQLARSAAALPEIPDLLSVRDQSQTETTASASVTSAVSIEAENRVDLSDVSVRELFWVHVNELRRQGCKSRAEIGKTLGVNKPQADYWLQEAVPDDRLDRINQANIGEVSLYELFLIHVRSLCRDGPGSLAEIVGALAVRKSQANQWLKQAVSEKKLKKLTRPIRYRLPQENVVPEKAVVQSDMFARVEDG